MEDIKNKIINYRHTEASNKYVSEKIIDLYDKISSIPSSDINKKFFYYFNMYENNYVIKRVRDSIKEKFPNFEYELDSEHKFISIIFNKLM